MGAMNTLETEQVQASNRKHYKAKICLVGNPAVGKTSLVRRYVLSNFDDKYLTTLGTKVTKKQVHVLDPSRSVDATLDLMIWDIMGQPGFREMLKDAYFFDAKAILAVADVTKRDSLTDLESWIRAVEGVAGKVPVVVAINKADLTSTAQFDQAEAVRTATTFGGDLFMTSAKTGANVEEAFRRLGVRVLEKLDNGRH